MSAPDRSIRFVFDTVVDAYASGRPDVPLEAVQAAAEAMELPPGARVLEVGAGCGQLTRALVEAGFDVVSLEPGPALRACAGARVPAAELVGATFEEYEPAGRFDAVFSSNAFHWVDPAVGYAKAAEFAGALVLIWDTAFVADAGLRRAVQDGVLIPHGSTFPTEEADVRRFVLEEQAGVREGLRHSGLFEEPWTQLHERTLSYTPRRYLDLTASVGWVASSGRSDAILGELEPLLGEDPFDVTDLVWTIAARVA
jgi:protein-L-isoaspartate O-methyltransferase